MTTIVTAIVGVVLAAGTVAGIVTSVHSSDRPTPKSPAANVKLYGQR